MSQPEAHGKPKRGHKHKAEPQAPAPEETEVTPDQQEPVKGKSKKKKKKKDEVKKETKEPEVDMYYLMILYAVVNYLGKEEKKKKEESEKKKQEEAAALAELTKKHKKELLKQQKFEKKLKAKEEKEKEEAAGPCQYFTETTKLIQCSETTYPDPCKLEGPLDTFGKVTHVEIEGPPNMLHKLPKMIEEHRTAADATTVARPPLRTTVCPPASSCWDFYISTLDVLIYIYDLWLNLHFLCKFFLIMGLLLVYYNGNFPSILPRSFPFNLFLVLFLDSEFERFNYIPGLLLLLVPLELFSSYFEKVITYLEGYLTAMIGFVLLGIVVGHWLLEHYREQRDNVCQTHETRRIRLVY